LEIEGSISGSMTTWIVEETTDTIVRSFPDEEVT
jgi:hypothetical protein